VLQSAETDYLDQSDELLGRDVRNPHELTRRTTAPLVGLLAALVGLGLIAAPAVGSGGLVQLPGQSGCVSQTGEEGCAKARALEGVYTVAVTTDGRTAYATSFDSDAIAIFARNPRTGELRQKQGEAGCISLSDREGCAVGRALDGARGIARSPDGRNVYVASPESNAIAVFARDQRTGALRQLPGKGGCVSPGGEGGCESGRGLEFVSAITTSADGRNVYAAADVSNALTVFRRNPRTGALTQLPGQAGCISESGQEECALGRGLDQAFFVSKTRDGRNVYAASFHSDSIAVFTRNPRTGALSQLPGAAGCVSRDGSGGACEKGKALDDVQVFVPTPDGRSGYGIAPAATSAEEGAGGISIFDRNPKTGALHQKAGTAGCVSFDGSGGSCEQARAVHQPSAATISPDGRSLYVGSFGSNAVAIFTRNPKTGGLTQAAAAAGCISQDGLDGCRKGRALDGVITLSLSPDGKNLYTASIGSGAIAILDRR